MEKLYDATKIKKRHNKVEIRNKIYEFDSSFSIGSYMDAKEVIETTSNYKKAFFIILDDVFEISLKNNDIKKYILHNLSTDKYVEIMLLIYSNEEEVSIFQSLNDIDNIFEKFFVVIDKYFIRIMADTIKPVIMPMADKLSWIGKKINESLTNTFKTIVPKLTEIIESLNIGEKFDETTLRKWAEYGWTTVGEAPIGLFFEKPSSQEEADIICLAYFSDEYIKELFFEVESNSYDKQYIIEAKSLFYDEKYLSCAMLLIASIDRIFTENIVVSHEKKNGKKAVRQIAKSFKNKNDKILHNIFIAYNLNAYFDKLFDYGGNFDKEINYLNRNYLMHGWQNKSINLNKTECIKLLNALYNLQNNILEIKEIISETNN